VIKGTKFLLLKGKENLSDDGKTRLMALMAANEPLYKVYLLTQVPHDLPQLGLSAYDRPNVFNPGFQNMLK